jgi:3-oxoadipate enol-lactonase
MLAHRIDGSGPLVALLNGGLMSIASWDPVMEHLTGVSTLRLDFRGQLLSGEDPPGSIGEHADDVIALLDHLAIESVHLAGTSFGGIVAIETALRAPRRVRSLALIATTHRHPADLWVRGERLRNAIRAAAAGGDRLAVYDALVEITFSPSYLEANGGKIALQRERIGLLPPRYFTNLEQLLAAVDPIDFTSRLGEIAVPTLVVAAELDGTFPLPFSEELARSVPRGRLRLIGGAGHGVVVERPDEVARAILESIGIPAVEHAS